MTNTHNPLDPAFIAWCFGGPRPEDSGKPWYIKPPTVMPEQLKSIRARKRESEVFAKLQAVVEEYMTVAEQLTSAPSRRVSRELFMLGAEIAGPKQTTEWVNAWTVSQADKAKAFWQSLQAHLGL